MPKRKRSNSENDVHKKAKENDIEHYINAIDNLIKDSIPLENKLDKKFKNKN